MAGLINEKFKEEVLVELSWIMSAIDYISSKLEVETYEMALIRYRIQPEEEQAINKFLLSNFKNIDNLKIEDIRKNIANIFFEETNKEWYMLDDILSKMINLKIEQLKK